MAVPPHLQPPQSTGKKILANPPFEAGRIFCAYTTSILYWIRDDDLRSWVLKKERNAKSFSRMFG